MRKISCFSNMSVSLPSYSTKEQLSSDEITVINKNNGKMLSTLTVK